jgi:hypothetical protein
VETLAAVRQESLATKPLDHAFARFSEIADLTHH